MRRREFLSGLAIGTTAPMMSGCATTAETPPPLNTRIPYQPVPPEREAELIGAANFGRKSPASGQNGLAISTHPLVSQVAVNVLKEGGNAVDAICAASVAQTVLEPHMTTLTGVFSLQYYEAKTGKVTYLNCSNNAPLNFPLTVQMLSTEMNAIFADGRGVTVPGFWAGIEAAMNKYGTISMKRCLAPAIDYARNGFSNHGFLWGEIFISLEKISKSKQGMEIFMPGNAILKPGEVLYQKRAADLLERLAEEGSNYFYHGGFAESFSNEVQAAGGWITPDDFAAYEPMWQEPIQTTYRGYDLVAAPDPDHGGVIIGEIMKMTELLDLQKLGPSWDSDETAFRLMQIIGRVTADNFIQAYTGGKPDMATRVSGAYAEERFSKLGDSAPVNFIEELMKLGGGDAAPYPGSNHLTVTDAEGNVATVLHSCMALPWSNGLFVDGISICAAGSHFGAGIPAPGGRINAAIAPHMFLKNGKCVIAGGSPSVSLKENITQNAINLLDFGMSIGDAVHKPRFGGSSMSKPGSIIMEPDMPVGVIKRLEDSGGKIDLVNPWNWSNGSYDSIYIDPDSGTAHACADPRRTGMAIAV